MNKANPLKEKTWDEFQKTGLIWFINRILHLFGWVLVLDISKEKEIIRAYPARTTYRGFTYDVEERGYRRLTKYMKENASTLFKEIQPIKKRKKK